MNIEQREKINEIKKLGNIEIEKTADGKVSRIDNIAIREDDKIFVVQRHQKPDPFTKEQLLSSPSDGIDELSSLDYVYSPEVNEEGTKKEQKLLSESKIALGDIDLVATTPQKRGSEHKELLEKNFPDSQKNDSIDQLLDDSGLGLVGESYYGGHEFNLDETRQHLRQKATIPWKFKPSSYMEVWVKLGYRNPDSRWKIENPEELCERTERIFEKSQKKNFFITHEANCVAFHMLAERESSDLDNLIDKIEIPDEIKDDITQEIGKSKNLLDLFKIVSGSLSKHKIKKDKKQKIQTLFLENMGLKSGDNSKGYGALSMYVLKKKDGDETELREVAYDMQI